MRTEIILQHGWAFDSSRFDEFAARLEALPQVLSVHKAEEGYFGLPAERPVFSPLASTRIIVAHSLGLHLLDPACLHSAHAVVAISTFASFHEGTPLQIRRSRRLVNAMLAKLDHDPDEVLQDFYRQCFAPEVPDAQTAHCCGAQSALNLTALKAGLQTLNEHALAGDQLSGKRLILVHGKQDQIVPVESSRRLCRLAASRRLDVELHVIAEAGHALPFTHAELCLQLIAAEIAGVSKSPEGMVSEVLDVACTDS